MIIRDLGSQQAIWDMWSVVAFLGIGSKLKVLVTELLNLNQF